MMTTTVSSRRSLRAALLPLFALTLGLGLGAEASAQDFSQLPPPKQAAIQAVLTEHAAVSEAIKANVRQARATLEQRIQGELSQTQAGVFNLTTLRSELRMAAQQAASAGDAATVQALLERAVFSAMVQTNLVAAQTSRIQLYTATFSAAVHQATVALNQHRALTMARIHAIINA